MRSLYPLALAPLALLAQQQGVKAEAPPQPERAPLSWEEHQNWKPQPIVPRVAPEQLAPELSEVPLPIPDALPPVIEPVELLPPPPALEAAGLVPAKAEAKAIKLQPIEITQSQLANPDGATVTPTEEVLPFERPEPATTEDLLVNYRDPELRNRTDEFADINIQVSSVRPLEISAKVISGNVIIGNTELRAITPGRGTSFRAIAGQGKAKIGLYNAEGQLVRELPIEVSRTGRFSHTLSGGVSQSQVLNGEADPQISLNANYNIRSREGGWSVNLGTSYNPAANGSDGNRSFRVGFSLTL